MTFWKAKPSNGSGNFIKTWKVFAQWWVNCLAVAYECFPLAVFWRGGNDKLVGRRNGFGLELLWRE
jgi:hypothetical protein